MNKMMVPTCVHLPVCCLLLLHLLFCALVFQGIAIDFWWLFYFPIFPAPTFSPFSAFGFHAHVFFLVFVTTMFLVFQGGSPMINGFSIASRPPIFPLTFVFSTTGGGRADLQI